ncbi:MAG: hypothetical protein GXO54_02540 [Chloroflexi bacterium]|nr:hypothetical protein [Chloroflexota bacterium]
MRFVRWIRARGTMLLRRPLLIALLGYWALRFVGLYHYPVYFFCDEANQTLLAEQLVQRGFRGDRGELLPTFFRNVYFYNLGVSVYVQVLPYLLVGKRIWATRGVSILISGLAAWVVARWAQAYDGHRYSWVGVGVLSAMPAWFLHSRTAFEVVEAVAFWAMALWFYARYRHGKPHGLYAALLFAGLTFYTYSPARAVVPATVLALLLLDAHHHRRHIRTVTRGLLLTGLLAWPYVRFVRLYPHTVSEHLARLGSYWVAPIPLHEKLLRFGRIYLAGLDPRFWFSMHPPDLPRHLMDHWGHVGLWFAPLTAYGAWRYAQRAREDASARLVWLAYLTAPLGAALADVTITRAMFALIPLAIWTTHGLLTMLERDLPRIWTWLRAPQRQARLVAGLLGGLNLTIATLALTVGPLWFRNYGLYGMQYGAPWVFWAIRDTFADYPTLEAIYLSPNWANGVNLLHAYFLTPEEQARVPILGLGDALQRRVFEGPQYLYVITRDEWAQVQAQRHKFRRIEVDRILPYPDGTPGFYFIWWEYADDFERIVEKERAALLEPQSARLEVFGHPARVTYPPLDIGWIGDAFDGNPNTLIRTARANPMRLIVHWDNPVTLAGLRLKLGGAQALVYVRLTSPEGNEEAWTVEHRGSPEQPWLTLRWAAPQPVQVLNVLIRDLNQPIDEGHVHVWEIEPYP